ncbi:ABC transporter permease [Galbitalea sp. SE-J8]|uniref:ABC transporter permease n=1 Tax=Galbitalea sp. SE-J8 TaxID=3054952 RepID=UPI00259C7110|nr:ABC transporter permease [Galbitalea sp. SE-J8]MDM4763892.1 ABC transporter permease [Galbitalea sp. SE-J8]
MRMLRFAGVRVLGAIVVLLLITVLTYAVFYLLPANPAQLSCGRPCTPENLRRAAEFMGTDLPWWQQLLEFLRGIVLGRDFGSGAAAVHCAAPCFGYSFQQNASVTELILSRFPVTASIAIGAAVLWLVTGVAGGVASGMRPGSVVDRGVMMVSIAGVSAPVYLVGLLAILLFGFVLRWLPTGGYIPFATDPVQWFAHLLLPWCTLAFTTAAVYARLTRGQMIETLGEDYIRTARAKGLRESRVVVRHGLRNAILPVVTVFGLDLGTLLGGTVIVERVFSMQGLGALLVTGVSVVDLQLVVGFTLFSAFLIIVSNVVIDVVNGVVDPRAKATA